MQRLPSWFALLLCLAPGVNCFAYEPASAYEEVSVAGLTVMISPELKDHPAATQAALDEIGKQLGEIEAAVDPALREWFGSVRIWLEWRRKPNGAAEYHPSRRWLEANGYNPEKEKSIEINNARNFVDWSRRAQPSMLLHELAHAFHHQVLGFDDEEILKTFRQARDSERYLEVEHVNGSRGRAYAMMDEKEYFAELTEAFFGRNDFYPFDREELKEFDPEGFSLMQRKWKLPPPEDEMDPVASGNPRR